MYERFHVADIVIDDEQGDNGVRDISVFVDTHEKVSVELGNSLTIRTDEQGLEALRHLLHDASLRLDQVRYEKVNREMDEASERMNSPTASAVSAPDIQTARSDQQLVDPFDYLANDPGKW